MTEERAEVIFPRLDELLPTQDARERFDETSAALEAADLVRMLRQQALTVSGTRGISQSDLASRAGLSQPRISQIESGEGRDGPTYAVIRKIAHACGVPWGKVILDLVSGLQNSGTKPQHPDRFHNVNMVRSAERVTLPDMPFKVIH